MAPDHLIVFVKAPRPGQVKTRLAAAVGDTQAAEIYLRLLRRTVLAFSELPQVEVRFAPDEAEAEIRPWVLSPWRRRPQGEGDLGARLRRGFAEAFAGGARRVVVVGSDCPGVERGDIEAAWAALAAHDVVLGPARDGGYWLVGLRAPQPALFEEIAWGGSAVLCQTRERAAQRGLEVHLLRELADVDTLEDWEAYLRNARACG